ncbi:MAG: dihydrolipoyl dehydrogenase family protein [Chloroflexota bacterium]
MEKDYDVVVIGGGTAGLTAAKRLAGYGRRVALVERSRLGGECLWTGCIPAKAMITSANTYHLMQRAGEFGLPECSPPADWSRVVRAKDRVVARIALEDAPEAMARRGVDVYTGTATFVASHRVLVGGQHLSARHFVIATGSRQAIPSFIPGLVEIGYITHVEAISLPVLPARLAVVGGGPVGVEFAQLFARLGAQVTLVERSEFILSQEDTEVSAFLQELLLAEGLDVRSATSAKSARATAGGKALLMRTGELETEIEVDEILVATGRAPNIEGLNLVKAGVQVSKRGIEVDAYLRSSAPHIFACGDVAGGYQFSHIAEYQAGMVVHNILSPEHPRAAEYAVVPWATFTDPEVAHVGLTEAEAAAGQAIQVERFSLAGLDRALILRQARGLVKVIAEAGTGRILGAHIVGPNASNLIHEYALAMRAGILLPEIADTIHAYPTLSEAVKAAAGKF